MCGRASGAPVPVSTPWKYRVSPVRRGREWVACRLDVAGGRGCTIARAALLSRGVPDQSRGKSSNGCK